MLKTRRTKRTFSPEFKLEAKRRQQSAIAKLTEPAV